MEFIVVSEDVETLIGLPILRKMGLIHQAEAVKGENELPGGVNKFTNVFEGLGRLPGAYRINLCKDAQSVIQPARIESPSNTDSNYNVS